MGITIAFNLQLFAGDSTAAAFILSNFRIIDYCCTEERESSGIYGASPTSTLTIYCVLYYFSLYFIYGAVPLLMWWSHRP